MDRGPPKPEPGTVRDSASGTYSGSDPASSADAAFAPRCLSVDLEVGKEDSRIHRFAAVRGDTGESIHFRGGDLNAGLARLDRMADGAAFVVGRRDEAEAEYRDSIRCEQWEVVVPELVFDSEL